MKRDSSPPNRPNLRLRHEREVKNWSQEDLAEHIGTTAINVSRWERGVTFPGRYFRGKLCEEFGKQPDELGLLPSALDVVDDASRQFLDDPTAMPPTAAFIPHELAMPPVEAPHFGLVGRTQMLGRLKQQICVAGARVALAGLPGVGKTALALALVHDSDVQRYFPDGVLWAGLGPQPNVLGTLGAWGAALHLSAPELAHLGHLDERARAIRAVIGTRRMLLVVDDVWDAEVGLAFKVGGANCAFLVTTRFPAVAVRIAGEAFTQVQELSEDDSLTLLRQLAPEVALSEPDEMLGLVRSVDGLPLALALMGRYLHLQAHGGQPRRVKSALEQLRRTTERLRLAEPTAAGDRPTSLPANTHLSLHAVIAVSDKLLDTAASGAMRPLSIFPPKPNSFSEEAALAVSNSSEAILDTLCDAGLLESSGPGRYTLHRTIADYARHVMADDTPYARFITYFTSYAKAHANDSAALDLEKDNVLAALKFAAERRADLALVEGAVAMAPYLEAHGLYADAANHLRQAERIARAANDNAGLARVAMHLGHIAGLQGDTTRANALYAEALRAARAIDDHEAICAVLTFWGEELIKYDDYPRAEQCVREALILARELGDRQRTAVLLRLLGEISDSQGDSRRGETCANEGLAIAREVGDLATMSALLQNLGVRAERSGDYARADMFYTEGLVIARQIGHRQRISALLMNVGMLAIRRQRYDEAEALHQESLAIARTGQDHMRISSVLQNLGIIATRQGRYADAEAYLRESLDLARQSGYRWLMSECLCEWGELRLRQGQLDAASEMFEQAHTLAVEMRAPQLSAAAAFGLAQVAALNGSPVEAYRCGQEALQQFTAMGHERTREVERWLQLLPSPRSAG
ncbi:MAG TPA: tetratricopeptide repeat protein [Ktedonobacterales bacterium]